MVSRGWEYFAHFCSKKGQNFFSQSEGCRPDGEGAPVHVLDGDVVVLGLGAQGGDALGVRDWKSNIGIYRVFFLTGPP